MAETSGEISANNDENSFVFGLNDSDFSDCMLCLRIIPDSNYCDHSFDSNKMITESQDLDSSSGAVKLTTLLISSIILAAKSPFFFKLFKNGMRESQNKTNVSLTIKESEESSFIELVNFMYGNTSISTSEQHLVNLLVVGDKFDVSSCMRFCVDMLLKLPMSQESALLYLELPSSILVNDIVKPLLDAAKHFVATLYRNFSKSREELMKLPLSIIEAVLGSRGVLVNSEDEVYEFILEWGRKFYPDQEERRETMTHHLAALIRFPNMSCTKLKEVLLCPEFDHSHVSKLVMEAIFSKVELPWLQTINVSNNLGRTPQELSLSARVYSPHCVVSFDIKKDELKGLTASNEIRSWSFCVGATQFCLKAKQYVEKGEKHLALYLHMEKYTNTCPFDYEFDVMNKSSMEFQTKFKIQDYVFQAAGTGYGVHNLLGMTWTELMSDNNDYFIDDILYIRVLVKVKTS